MPWRRRRVAAPLQALYADSEISPVLAAGFQPAVLGEEDGAALAARLPREREAVGSVAPGGSRT